MTVSTTSRTCSPAWCWKARSATWRSSALFVDLGVHQDGLVHVSQLSNKFVNDAREVVRTGQIVKVRVVEVDLARKRIGLTMKLDAPTPQRGDKADNAYRPAARGERARPAAQPSAQGGQGGQGAMAAAFAKLQAKR